MRQHKCKPRTLDNVRAHVPNTVWPHVVLDIPSNWIHEGGDARTELRITEAERRELIACLMGVEARAAG
jgi:hypothetical protein